MSEDVKTSVAESSPATPVQYDGWDDKGTPIVTARKEVPPKTQDSAPADTQKDEKSEAKAENAADTETASEGKSHKSKPDAESRIRDLVAEKKRLQAELDQERSTKAKTQADSSPAPRKEEQRAEAEATKRPVRPKLKDFDGSAGKTAEDYDAALEKYEEERDAYIRAASKEEYRQEQARQEHARQFADKLTEAEKRYSDFNNDKINETSGKIMAEEKMPLAVKYAIANSEVLPDLMYVLSGDEKKLNEVIELSSKNPIAALKYIARLEVLIEQELAKGTKKESTKDAKSEAADDGDKGDKGKDKGKAPKDDKSAITPPSEVGGRGTALDDGLVAAARANDFRAFEAEQNRRHLASRK